MMPVAVSWRRDQIDFKCLPVNLAYLLSETRTSSARRKLLQDSSPLVPVSRVCERSSLPPPSAAMSLHEQDPATQQAGQYPLERYSLHVPPLQEVADLLARGLAPSFQEVIVTVIPCPDLRSPPFHLAAAGLSGRPAICDVSTSVPKPPPLTHMVRR